MISIDSVTHHLTLGIALRGSAAYTVELEVNEDRPILSATER